MSYRDQWFGISADGLEKTLQRRGGPSDGGRGKAWVVYELIQNALDAGAKTITVQLDPVDGKPQVELTVTDDVPDGWHDITHAWTMFAESEKKGDASKAGKFDVGEKFVLASCIEASIITTTSSVIFDQRGRTTTRQRRECGSEFWGLVKMTRDELAEVMAGCRLLLADENCAITINGERLPERKLVASFEAPLATEIADGDRVLRPTTRKTVIDVYETLPGETPNIYEFVIPVVETEDHYHVAIRQRVPVSMERDNVPPAYLRKLRALVLNATAHQLPADELARPWVSEALTHKDVSAAAVNATVTARFGEKRVSYDPSDREANSRAVGAGYTVIPGRALPAGAWDKIREHKIVEPAGRVTPGAAVWAKNTVWSEDGREIKRVEPEKWTDGMREVISFYQKLGRLFFDFDVEVVVYSDMAMVAAAAYGSRRLVLNKVRLGNDFFERGIDQSVVSLGLHEFSHERGGGDHLSDELHEEACRLGAILALKGLPR